VVGHLDREKFEIASLRNATGTLGICPVPATSEDVICVEHWQPDLVLSILETSELQNLAHRNFVQSTKWQKMLLSVVDFRMPQESDLEHWAEMRSAALTCLADDGRVLVHCRGGCGRSGMIVLALLIALGEDAEAALTRLRFARPCAIETQDQLAWAKNVAIA